MIVLSVYIEGCMNRTDKMILDCIKANELISNVELARCVGRTRQTVVRRLKILRASGAISNEIVVATGGGYRNKWTVHHG